MKHGHRVTIGALVVVALAVAVALIAAGGQGAFAAPSIIYVDADAMGGDDGSSWDDAYTDLQPALAAASSRDEIWVAAGTYKPTSGTDRYASFQMVNGVEIYGGFDPGAGATKFRDRDWVTYATILSGDIGTEGDRSDNSYHVFYHPDGTNLDRSAILDGFTISGGNADGGTWPHWDGGGMYNDASSPSLTNCTFEGNSSTAGGGGMSNWTSSSPLLTNCTFEGNWSNLSGGGMFSDHSSPVLINCTFSGNWAEDSGGGMLNTWESPAELINCTFEGNSANENGGGVFNYASSPTLADCTFEGNSTDNKGGGVYNYSASPMLTNCAFLGNSAQLGGGMYNDTNSSPLLTDCALSGNSTVTGGGVFNYTNTAPVFVNCIFRDNSATSNGGGMYNWEALPVLTNCTFSGNSAGSMGGGMQNWYATPALTNCTFWGNQAGSGGGAMWNTHCSPTLTNCILWNDTSPEIYDYGDPSFVTYSDVQGGYAGTGNINAPPLFVDPENGDFHLAPNSPCIDAGDNAASHLPAYDFEGDARILDGDGDDVAIVDMGADEYIILTISVEIDITPNTPSNMIKLGSGADVPVAVLTTGDFEAADVNPDTVLFAGAEPEAWVWVDVDGDEEDDLLLYFDPRDLDLDESDRQATLTGLTNDGVPIEGTDRVKVKE